MVAPAALLADPFAAASLREHRRRTGTDKWDEVWEGRYVFMPPRWNWEASAVGDLCYHLSSHGEGQDWEVFPGVNVSDQRTDWERNYRCPDVAHIPVGEPGGGLRDALFRRPRSGRRGP